MHIHCPHCSGVISITKAEDVTNVQTPAEGGEDLASGVSQNVAKAIQDKSLEFDEKLEAMTGLKRLQGLTSGSFSKESTDTLSGGFSGAMAEALRARETDKSSSDLSDLRGCDPEMVNKEKAARVVQGLIGRALGSSTNSANE